MPGQLGATLHDVLTLTQQAIAARVAPGTAPGLAMRRVATALERPIDQKPVDRKLAPSPQTLPACAHLDAALTAAERGPADLARVAQALRGLAPRLVWRSRSGGDEAFAAGHANADLVGPSELALERRDDAWIGLSLMAPGLIYPDHHHLPEEVYLVLSAGDWRQNADAWHAPGLGGIVYNPPDIVHAMRSGAAPLLAVWCLPLK